MTATVTVTVTVTVIDVAFVPGVTVTNSITEIWVKVTVTVTDY